MNKVGKAAMYVMGASMIAGASYYMGLPKNKKKDVKDKLQQKMELDKEVLDDMM